MRKISSFWIIVLSMRLWQTVASHEIYLNDNQTVIYRNPRYKRHFTESINSSVIDLSPRCVQMQCKVVCFNGKSYDIEYDVKRALSFLRTNCSILTELCLYNYKFPEERIHRNFLGYFSNKVKSLYIAASNVKHIEGGAFGNGIFEKLKFEHLMLDELDDNFFRNISNTFSALSIIQPNNPMTWISKRFLDNVKTQIKSLTLRVGITIKCVENMTSSHNLLSNLAYIDYSHNNFGASLTDNIFGMLSMVEHLDLSYSKIISLPNYIFSNFVSTLKYLDISHNYLKTISIDVFGWQGARNDLKVFANDNKWYCSCELYTEMQILFGQQSAKIYCEYPEEFYKWSVFDTRICDGILEEVLPTTTTEKSTPHIGETTRQSIMTKPSTTRFPINNSIHLTCHSNAVNFAKKLLRFESSLMDYAIEAYSDQRVNIIMRNVNRKLEEYGLIWFSKETNQLNSLNEIYNQHRFGCYKSISHQATIKNLLPNAAYTFCLVQKGETTVIPFNCKSVHLPGNIQVRSAWLKRDIRSTGISLIIFGVLICTFIGILIAYLILKHKPILLKGSKRIATTKCCGNKIVVLPKDQSLDDLRVKEEQLAKKSSKSNTSRMRSRSNSLGSNVSYQSYMYTNIYEEVPTYINIVSSSSCTALKEFDNNYVPPQSKNANVKHFVTYAEIPFSRKRASNDPLPELPKKNEANISSTYFETNGILKHNFKLSTGYAFAYDCVV